MKIINIQYKLGKKYNLDLLKDKCNDPHIETLLQCGYRNYFVEHSPAREALKQVLDTLLKSASVDSNQIHFIIGGQSGIPDYIGIDLACQAGAEIDAQHVKTMNLNEGCASGLSVWEQAQISVKSLPKGKVGLVVLANTMSDPHQNRFRLMNAVLSDAFAVALVTNDDYEYYDLTLKLKASDHISNCKFVDMMRVEYGGRLNPNCLTESESSKDTLGRDKIMSLFEFNNNHLQTFLNERNQRTLDITKKVFESINEPLNNPYYIHGVESHNAIKYLCEHYSVDLHRSNHDQLAQIGHAGCADILIGLKLAMESGEIKKDEHILCSTISTGMKWSAAVFKMS
tara:strand:+ start:12210 stop:13232 length:1023 start_codon:yes stop_codon:yes gene_type:complete